MTTTTTRTTIKSFEQCNGIDVVHSSLTKDRKTFEKLVNVVPTEGYSLTKRHGNTLESLGVAPFGLHNHIHYDVNTGSTEEELLFFGAHIFKLVKSNLEIYLKGGDANWAWRFYPKYDTTTSTPKYVFEIWQGTPLELYFTWSYDTAIKSGQVWPSTFAGSLYWLIAAVNATANFGITLPSHGLVGPCGLVSADTSGTSLTLIPLTAGHTFVEGDLFAFHAEDSAVRSTNGVFNSEVSGVTATGCYASLPSGVNWDILSGQPIGWWEAPISCIPFKELTETDEFIPIETIAPVPATVNIAACAANLFYPAMHGFVSSSSVVRVNINAIDSNNVCLIGYGFSGYPYSSSRGEGQGLYQYDGQRVYRLGLPKPATAPVLSASGSGKTFAYKYRYKQVDARGNIIYSDMSSSATIATTAISISITCDRLRDEDKERANYNLAGAALSASVSSATVLPVDDGAGHTHTLRVGDEAVFIDSSGVLQRQKITARTATSITIGTAVTAADNTPISCGATIEIYRTQDSGDIFYLCAEIPNHPWPYATAATYTDTMADATLLGKVRYEEPEYGWELDEPPLASIACEHQGCIIAAGLLDEPNTVGISLPGDPWHFPLSDRYFDLPSAVGGPITAIASDTDGHMAIFKEHAYYDLIGDVTTGAYTVEKVKEGDYGISSHKSLVKINGTLIGVGPMGVVSISGGKMDATIGLPILPMILKNKNIDLRSAVGFNDYQSQQYRLIVPPISDRLLLNERDANTYLDRSGGTQMTYYSSPNFLSIAYDYGTLSGWIENTFIGGFDGAAGMAIFNDDLYAAGKSSFYGCAGSAEGYDWGGSVARRITEPATEAYAFWDEGAPIPWYAQSGFEALDEPKIDKIFPELGLYLLPSAFETKLAHSLQALTFKNWDRTIAISKATLAITDKTLYVSQRLLSDKSRSLAVAFFENTLFQAPFLTGIELTVSAEYGLEGTAAKTFSVKG